MFHNRITMMEEEPIRLPQPPAPLPNPCAFVLCPVGGMSPAQWTALQWLYQRALEAAQAVAKPSLPERDLAGVWN